jgi:dUTPase
MIPMTDITKYRNVSLRHDTYSKIEKLSRTITPGIKLSMSKTVEALVSDRISRPHKQGTNGSD